MMALAWIRFILGAVFLFAGIVFYAIQFIGLFRFKYVLNRMHAAAIGDTLGSGLMMAGTVFLYGLSFATVKLILIIVFLWFTAPVASHMLAQLEVDSKKSPDYCCPVKTVEEIEESLADVESATAEISGSANASSDEVTYPDEGEKEVSI